MRSPRELEACLKRFTVLLLLAAWSPQDPERTIRFAVPEGTASAELKDAASVLQRRCEDYGLKGFKAKVDAEGRIQLTHASAISPDLKARLKTLASIAAAKVEVRLNIEGLERYKVGDEAPAGSEWVRDPEPEWVRDCKLSSFPGCWWLLNKEPRIDVRVKWKPARSGRGRVRIAGMVWVENEPEGDEALEGFQGPTKTYLEFDKSASKRLMDLSVQQRGRMRLFVDGVCIDTGGVLYDAGWTGGKARWDTVTSREDRIMGICLSNPSPVSMIEIEDDQEE